jgi:hypothetical protein
MTEITNDQHKIFIMIHSIGNKATQSTVENGSLVDQIILECFGRYVSQYNVR